jgi:hypothetical protein
VISTREHYRQRRISECIRRYQPTVLPNGMHGARDIETGHVIADYADAELARAKCRMLAAADIESLYMPDEPTALARIATIIAEQSDREWAARMIFDLFQGAKK